MKNVNVRYLLPFLLLMVCAVPLCGYFTAGQKLTYDITFGNILKGNAELKFFGKVASITEAETLQVMTDSALIDAGLAGPPESTLVIDADSMIMYSPPDTSGELPSDSSLSEEPVPMPVINETVHDIYFITYETRFIGNIYSLHADIYTNEEFFPLLIETKITRSGNKSKGKELFFPDRKMAVFSQTIGETEEVDTLRREHPLQDITTLPIYLSQLNKSVGSTLDVSLAQGELTLTYVDTEIIEYGEGHDYRYYDTYRIESEPKGFRLWLATKNKVPVKVHIDNQKIKMMLVNREIDKSMSGVLSEDRIKQKLGHVFPQK
jgi:hypothetical protein